MITITENQLVLIILVSLGSGMIVGAITIHSLWKSTLKKYGLLGR
jgi:uncharacterized membrane protein YedE/YeeE